MQRIRRWTSAVVTLSMAAGGALSPEPASAELGSDYTYPGDWQPIDQMYLVGPIVGGPAVSSWGPRRLDTWGVGGDGAIWHHFATPQGGSWESLGGGSAERPAGVGTEEGRADVFIRGLDGALWQRSFGPDGWGSWSSLGGGFTGAPAVTSGAPGQIDVVVAGLDGAAWHRASRDGTWGPWESLGGITRDAPTIASWNEQRLDVFVRGVDDALWHRYLTGGSWSAWTSLGGRLAGGPEAAAFVPRYLPPGSRLPERLVLVVPGADGNLYWQLFNGAGFFHSPSTPLGWSGWRLGPYSDTVAPTMAFTSLADLAVASGLWGDDARVTLLEVYPSGPGWLP